MIDAFPSALFEIMFQRKRHIFKKKKIRHVLANLVDQNHAIHRVHEIPHSCDNSELRPKIHQRMACILLLCEILFSLVCKICSYKSGVAHR